MGLRLLILALLLNSSSAQASTLSWDDALELIQKNNLELQGAIQNYETTRALEGSAQSGFYPRLSASLGESKSGAQNSPTVDSYLAQANLSQNLFSGLGDLRRYQQAQANTEAARATLISAKAKLSADFKQAVASLYFARDYHLLSSQIIQRRSENLKIVDLRFRGGRENKGSVLLSQAYLEQAQYDDTTAIHNFEVSIENVKRFLGLASQADVEMTDPIPQIELSSAPPKFELLSSQTPEVINARAQERSAQLSIEVARASFFPSLDVSAVYGKYDSFFFPEQNRWSVGLTLTVPLFDGGRDLAAVKSASFRAGSTSLQYSDLLLRNVTDLKQAYYSYVEAIQKEKVDQSFKSAAVVRAQIARSKYNNGLMTFEEWDLVENDLIAREKSVLNSRRDRIAKEATWEQSQGIGVIK